LWTLKTLVYSAAIKNGYFTNAFLMPAKRLANDSGRLKGCDSP
jgi:hypothetical protein